MAMTYGAFESGAVEAVRKSKRVKKLDGQTEGRTKHIHALALQSIYRHGKNVPAHVVHAEVKNAIRKSGRYGNPILILVMPFLIQFIQQIFGDFSFAQ